MILRAEYSSYLLWQAGACRFLMQRVGWPTSEAPLLPSALPPPCTACGIFLPLNLLVFILTLLDISRSVRYAVPAFSVQNLYLLFKISAIFGETKNRKTKRNFPFPKVNFSLREDRDAVRGRFTERKIKLLSVLSGGGVGAGETLRK